MLKKSTICVLFLSIKKYIAAVNQTVSTMKTIHQINTPNHVTAQQDRYSRVLPIRQVLSSYLTDLRDSKSVVAN